MQDAGKKTLNTHLKLEICVVCREVLAFKHVVIVFFETKKMIIYFCTSEILKTAVNKDENVHRFAVSAIRGKFVKRE